MSQLQTTEAKIRSIQAPTATRTWHPFPHALLLDELEMVREIAELDVTSRRYELTSEGRKFFGTWTFGNGEDPSTPQASIGFRNSIDRSLSVGLCAGTHVSVCSNLAFSGEWMQFRKHTRFVLEDLRLFVLEAFGKALQRGKEEVAWQSKMDTLHISMNDWKILTYDALDLNIIAPSKVTHVIEKGREGDFLLGGWFNTITSILSRRSLLHTEQNFIGLRGLVQSYLNWEVGR